MDAIQELRTDPFRHHAKKLRGQKNTWRVKVGSHLRIVFEVTENSVRVLFAGQRENAY